MLTSKKWRLFIDNSLPAAQNMAVDESLLESAISGDSPPILRFYGWEKPSLSLGVSQRFKETPLAVNVQKPQFQAVRRPTGGRAILHHLELTYSVVIPQNGTIFESYRIISEALQSGFQKLSVPVEWEKPERRAAGSSFCFAVPSAYELKLDGKKLVGSAQMRKNGWLLQHGSILLDLDGPLQKSVFGDDFSPTATLASFHLDRKTLTEALIAGFEERFRMKGEIGARSEKEIERMNTLIGDKYENPEWLFSR